jgi:hypothetical protein
VHFAIGLISHGQLIDDDDVDSSILNKTKKTVFMVRQSSKAEVDASVRPYKNNIQLAHTTMYSILL